MRLIYCLFAALLVLGGCAEKKPSPTVIDLSISAALNINPNAQGRASPVVLRVYHLTSPNAFEEADFFQLFEQDAAILGQDMIGREEIIVTPGAAQKVSQEVGPEVRYLGVIAAYRETETSVWRAMGDVVPEEINGYAVQIDALAVSLAKSEDD
ncbi:type VI secretion system lipoprotein TssJ [Pelagibius sp. Alg239-R121]|uniref:type VI secretion system lipoprotein TssJ n=1 Tax=Pelagibius sp. Alg239-R121 TaxID=2993448 RepID=UPI0024A76AA0|nr:type VI secretion system lipoprotein TssJ [Pelagibius sp. Alg239-R121]